MDGAVTNTNTNTSAGADLGDHEGQKTFTQDDVNRIVQDRLAKDRAKASEEMSKKEQELEQREFRLNSRQKLLERGYPDSLLDALNCSSKEAFDKALDTIDELIKDRMPSKQQQQQQELEAKRSQIIGAPIHQMNDAGSDMIKKAMGL